MNYSFFIGNLTKDPELDTVKDYARCQFTIAVQRRRLNKDGVREADFIPIIAWRQLAANCGKYLRKGSRVSVVAHVQVDHYQDSNGNKRIAYRFVADDVEFQPGGPRNNDNNGAGDEEVQQSGAEPGSGFVQVDDDELPF